MIYERCKPRGDFKNPQDPLPKNWREIAQREGNLPRRFSQVDENLYRSGIPFPHQVRYLREKYGIRNIVSLIDGNWLDEFEADSDIDVEIHRYPHLQRRELTPQRVKDIVGIIRHGLRGPTLVHCLKGVTRTGMVVAGYQMNVMGKNKWQARLMQLNPRHFNPNFSVFKEIAEYK